jgi:hypothetical protein
MTDRESELTDEWAALCSRVCDAMKEHTRPFITPLSRETSEKVWLEGTGTFVEVYEHRMLLTCEHVSCGEPLNHAYYGSEDTYQVVHPYVDSKSLDIAFVSLDDAVWNASEHLAKTIPFERFAHEHRTVDRAELLFIHGFAGENSKYGFETLNSDATAYLVQQKEDAAANDKIFELFWEPQETSFTETTPSAERTQFRFQNSGGLSGSLVWNTRFCEKLSDGSTWSPEDAVVTGLLRRWDTATKTLLALKVEHLRTWLQERIGASRSS